MPLRGMRQRVWLATKTASFVNDPVIDQWSQCALRNELFACCNAILCMQRGSVARVYGSFRVDLLFRGERQGCMSLSLDLVIQRDNIRARTRWIRLKWKWWSCVPSCLDADSTPRATSQCSSSGYARRWRRRTSKSVSRAPVIHH